MAAVRFTGTAQGTVLWRDGKVTREIAWGDAVSITDLAEGRIFWRPEANFTGSLQLPYEVRTRDVSDRLVWSHLTLPIRIQVDEDGDDTPIVHSPVTAVWDVDVPAVAAPVPTLTAGATGAGVGPAIALPLVQARSPR